MSPDYSRERDSQRGCRRNHGAVWTRNTPRETRVGLPSQLIVGNAERSVVTTGKGAWGDSVSETQHLCRGGNAGGKEKEMLQVCVCVCVCARVCVCVHVCMGQRGRGSVPSIVYYYMRGGTSVSLILRF